MYDNMEEEWTNGMLCKRDNSDLEKRRGLGRATMTTTKKRKFNLAGEDWGMVGQDRETLDRFLYSTDEMSTSRTDRVLKQDRLGCVRLLAIEWEGHRNQSESMNISTNVNTLSGVEKGPSSDGPTGVKATTTEYVRSPVNVDDDLCDVAKKEVREPPQVKKKVWTKLKNGLYGYRIVKTGKKQLSAKQLVVPEQGSPSAGAKLHENFKSSISSKTGGLGVSNSKFKTSTKRKYFEVGDRDLEESEKAKVRKQGL